jgi:hypothetical protein
MLIVQIPLANLSYATVLTLSNAIGLKLSIAVGPKLSYNIFFVFIAYTMYMNIPKRVHSLCMEEYHSAQTIFFSFFSVLK